MDIGTRYPSMNEFSRLALGQLAINEESELVIEL